MQIEVDFDVYKALFTRRSNESVSFNDVLRGLLKLEPKRNNTKRLNGSREWVVKGVRFPEGTEFRATYKADIYRARIKGGDFVMDEKKFKSPSEAAAHITKNSVNGWVFWEARLPDQGNYKILRSYRSAT